MRLLRAALLARLMGEHGQLLSLGCFGHHQNIQLIAIDVALDTAAYEAAQGVRINGVKLNRYRHQSSSSLACRSPWSGATAGADRQFVAE